MKVLLLQTGEPIPSDANSLRPMRATNLINALNKRGHTVELISSRFFHQKRRHRQEKSPIIYSSKRLTITLINSLGYKSNLGISRLIDHIYMSISLFIELLRKKVKPDIVFIGYPPIETAYIIALWSVYFRIPYMLDVKDFWPETIRLKISFLPSLIVRLLLYPYEHMAHFITKHATSLCTISPEALDKWNTNYNRERSVHDIVGYLSSSFDYEQESKVENTHKSYLSRFIYAGSLTSQLSLQSMFTAFSKLENKGEQSELLIIGEGPIKDKLILDSSHIPGVKFMDWMPPSKLIYYLKNSNAVLIPYKNSIDFELSIPNKAFDAIVFNLPIVSPLRGSLSKFIRTEGIGYTIFDTVEGWLAAFESITQRDDIYNQYLRNAINAKKKFNINNVYSQIVDKLEAIAI